MAEDLPKTVTNWRERTTELLPPEGDVAVGRACFELLDRVIKYKDSDLGLHRQWKRWYSLRKNKHFKDQGKASGLVSINLLGTIHERTVNLLTDNNPTFEATKAGEIPEGSSVETLLHCSDHWWSETEQQSILESSVNNGELYGVVIEKTVWNQSLNRGLGEVEAITVDPFFFGLYPVKTKEIQKAEAALHFYPISTLEAKRRWPHVKDEIHSDAEYIQQLGEERRQIVVGQKSDSGWKSTFSGIVKSVTNAISGGSKDESEEVLVLETWVKDYTEIKLETGELVRKYDGAIRRIRTCNGGEVVLDDMSNPSINPNLPVEQAMKTYLWDKFPFEKVEPVKDEVTGWGIAGYSQLEGLQKELDISISKFNVWRNSSHPILINPDDCGIPNDEFEVTAKAIIVNPASYLTAAGIRWVNPAPPDPNLLKAIELYKELVYMVSGAFDLDQAQAAGQNVIAYKAIAALLERVTTMLRGKVRAYGRLIRSRGRMYLSHAQNWYTQERWISYQQDGQEISEPVTGQSLMIPADLKVVSGSTMPVSQVQRRDEGIELFRMNAIDLDELHRRLDTPNRKALIKRMKEGPIGQIMQKLGAIGVPQQLLQIFGQVAQMDEKDLAKQIEKGKIPPVQQILQTIAQGQPPEDPTQAAQNQESNAKVQETLAKVDKIKADIALVNEMTVSERVKQDVSLNGVVLDKEKIKIERAKVVSDMRTKLAQEKFSSRKGGQGPFRERGMKSDNQQWRNP